MPAPAAVLLLAGLGFVGFGAAYAVRPRAMGALTDVVPETPSGLADFLATYGGFQIGFGVFLLGCLRAGLVAPGLWAATAALGGFAALRVVGILVAGGRVKRSIWAGLGIEIVGIALNLWGLARLS
jgi:hypothetical protein